MAERDKLIDRFGLLPTGEPDLSQKLYIVLPTIMMAYVDNIRLRALKYPELVALVPSSELNPESQKFYGFGEEGLLRSKDKMGMTDSCKPLTYDEVTARIDACEPKSQ